MIKKILFLIISIIIAQLAGAIGSVFTAPNIQNWYVFLEKPFFSPPDWLFAPAWISLYTLMGIAAFLVWSSCVKTAEGQTKKKIKVALGFYIAQLVLNAFWSIAFFGWQSPLAGLLVIIPLWFLILLTLIKFWQINKTAGLLFVPYLLWVSFATLLNFSIWQLNL